MKHFTRALLGLIALSWLGAGSARAAFFGIDEVAQGNPASAATYS